MKLNRYFRPSSAPETIVTLTEEDFSSLSPVRRAPSEIVDAVARQTLGVPWKVKPVSVLGTGTGLRYTYTAEGRTVHVDVPA